MITLIKKDCYLLKKQGLFVLFFDIIMIAYLSNRMKDTKLIGTCLLFALTSFITILLLKTTISINEAKYEKALSLICTTPCDRRSIIKEKYLFDYMIFFIFICLYTAESMFFADVNIPPLWFFAVTFLFICIYHSVVIPLEFKLGYEKSKYITTILIFVVPFLSPLLIQNIDLNSVKTLGISAIPEPVKCLLLILFAFIIDICSYFISRQFFLKKEL